MPNPAQTTVEGSEFRFRMELLDPATIPTDVATLSSDLDVFLETWQVGGEDANALRIAVEELLTNLGKFDGLAAIPGGVHVEGAVVVADADVRLVLSDNGSPFDPTRHPAPNLDPETFLARLPGGLGLHMLRQLFGDIHYRRENHRNVAVWRRKRSAPPVLDRRG